MTLILFYLQSYEDNQWTMAQQELFKVITELFVFIFSTIDINHISIMKEEWEWHNYILLYDKQ